MNEVDDAILEYFEDLGTVSGERVTLPPGPVHYNIVEVLGISSKSRSTFSRRMSNLADYGLLELVDETKSYYQVTDKGLRYLSGELDADELVETDS